jgi:hypothetical protein
MPKHPAAKQGRHRRYDFEALAGMSRGIVVVLGQGGIDALPDGAIFGDPREVDTIANVAQRVGRSPVPTCAPGPAAYGCSWDRTSGRRAPGGETSGIRRLVAGDDRAYSFVLNGAQKPVTRPALAADKEEGMKLLSVPERAVR